MKTKSIVTAILITIILVSCTLAATAVPPINTASPPPATFTFVAPSATLPPSEIAATATASPSVTDYLATSENTFPLELSEGLALFYLNIDFSNVIYTHESTPDGTTQNIWYIGKNGDGKGEFTFLVPAHYENVEMVYYLLSLGVTLKDGKNYTMSDDALQRQNAGLINSYGFTGSKAKVRILLGLNTGSYFRFGDPFSEIYASTQWDETVARFMETSNPNDLLSITVDGITGKLLSGMALQSDQLP